MELNQGLAHCLSHDVHWEYCWDYEERLEFIKQEKPPEEQALRLKLLQIVPDEMIPGRDSEEWQSCKQAGEARERAWQACGRAWQTWQQAWQD